MHLFVELEAHHGVIGADNADAGCADNVPDPNCSNQGGSKAYSADMFSRDLQK